MKYEIENWNNRTVFVFAKTLKTFEEFSEVIDTKIQPNSKTEIETTSWTQSFIFLKDGLEVYFENFYDEKPFYTFELYPFGSGNESDYIKLKSILNSLNDIK